MTAAERCRVHATGSAESFAAPLYWFGDKQIVHASAPDHAGTWIAWASPGARVRFAIPQWQGRVSPVFDSAREALLVDAAEGQRPLRRVTPLGGKGPMQRARALRRLGVRVLICGAVSRPLEAALTGAGIRVIPNTCGSVEEVLKAYLSGRLQEASFLMPGVPHRCCGASGGPRPRP